VNKTITRRIAHSIRRVSLLMIISFAFVVIVNTAQAETLRLLVLGDSLSAGYGLDEADSFPAQLERALVKAGHDIRVINAGVSGDTTAGGRGRIGWALAEKPDAVIVELGANDGLRGLSPEMSAENLTSIVTVIRDAGLPVLIAGMKAPPNLGPEYGQEFEQIYQPLEKFEGVTLYPFFLEGVAAIKHLNQADGIHPNAKGVEVMVKNILSAVETLISQVSSR